MSDFDVIVVGGGHAGCEAAFAAARRGCRTLLLAIGPDGIGAMSCNPAIGGVGKGHLVREVDVFAGIIGQAADDAAIHHRMLNASKGPAVRGPRVQADRRRFHASVRSQLATAASLTIAAGEVIDLLWRQERACGVRLADGFEIAGGAVVLATGTFLGGRLFRGSERIDGGRIGEPGAHPLARVLRDRGLRTQRFKTGTPPRLDGRTIDWSRLERQPSDRGRWTLSVWGQRSRESGLFCGLARTTRQTHDVIRDSGDRSPLLSGAIAGTGPRYCPSIEDKVRRFGDRDGHQIFLEPEEVSGRVVYPNGISTSLPTECQVAFVRTIAGLERCEIAVPGYAVEYDLIDPRQCDEHLMIRDCPGLFVAGQITGTTGYEEASALGLVAGLGASAWAIGASEVRFDRSSSFIGVLVDDLTVQGVTEPYRMLTARAEHRLSLRSDNAVSRLYGAASGSGLLTPSQRTRLEDRLARVAAFADQPTANLIVPADDEAAEQAAADRMYAPYVARQQAEAARLAVLDRALHVADFAAVGGLSAEMIERLRLARPTTIAQAARIPGITPAAVTALLAASRAAA